MGANQLTQARRPVNLITTRSFNRHDIFQGELPEPNATPQSSIPPVTPERAEGASKTSPHSALNLKAAKEFRRVAGKSLETYSAYGTTQHLYKMCSVHADYSIPQARDEDVEMPKTEDGEDLGIGEGWWHTGNFSNCWISIWAGRKGLDIDTRFRNWS